MRRPLRYFFLLFLCPVLFAVFSQILSAQTFSLFQIDPSGFPTIRAKVMGIDANNEPMQFTRENLELHEDGVSREITFLSCPEPKPIEPISSVLTLDISGSMKENLQRNLEIARAAARAWIEGMPLGISECAVTSFNKGSFLDQDFTIDARKLLDAVNSLQPEGGTEYDKGLIAPQTGAIPVALGGKHKRVVVFLTDGRGGGDQDEIIRQALAGDITIHCITVGLPAPPILKNIARQTGGLWFENVNTPEQAVEIYRILLQGSQGGAPCEIEWQSGPACDSLRSVVLDETQRKLQATGSYVAPASSIAELDIDPVSIRFGTVQPGTTEDRVVRLTALNNDVRIRSISSSDPRIVAVTNNAPPEYTIPVGGFRDVTFRFSPTDSSLVFAEISIETDGCAKILYAAGGQWGSGSGPAIKLVVPNGGERFPVGSTTDILWTGVLPTDTVTLEYSYDAGNSWNTITTSATDLQYSWLVPNTPSEICLARVSIDKPSGGGGPDPSFAEPITTFRDHTGRINVARFSPDGQYVATASDTIIDKVRVWETFSGDEYRSFTPAGKVVDLDFSLDGSLLAFTSSDGTWRVYDVKNGTLKSRGSETPGYAVTAISFSKTGNNIVATGNSRGEVRLWNIVTLDATTTRTFSTGFGTVNSLDYNPVSDEMVVAGNSDTIKVFDAAGINRAQIPRNFKQGHTGNRIQSARFSTDGTQIVSAAIDGTPLLWDRNGPGPRATFAGHNDAAFSPDRTLIVTGAGTLIFGSDQPDTARIWDRVTGNRLGALAGHGGVVSSVDITQVAGRYYILTGSSDHTAIVWEIQDQDSASGAGSDVSDDLWAIVAAEVRATDVDFGEVLLDSPKDSTLSGYVQNTGGIEITVKEMRIVGPDASRFEIVSGFPSYSIAPGQSAPLELRFAPDAVRPFNAQLQIITDVDTLWQNLTGIGVNPRLRVIATIIDFGRVEIGDRKDTIVNVVVTNTGTAPVTITSTPLRGPDMQSFSVLSGAGPFDLAAGASHTMSFRFEPVESGRTSSSVGFEFNGPGSPAIAILFGEGYCPATVSRAFGRIGNFSGQPGDTIALPFSIASLDGPAPLPPGPPLEPMEFTATFAVNRTLLAPLNRAANVGEDMGETHARFAGTWNPQDSTIVWDEEPRFKAALGNAETSPVRLVEMEWHRGCPPDFAIEEGSFTLTELCTDGGVRLFNTDGTLKLDRIEPNPASGNMSISFEVIESGPTALYVMDMHGRKIGTLLKGEMTAGAYRTDFNVATWPQGNYLVVLETPTAQLTKKLIVEK